MKWQRSTRHRGGRQEDGIKRRELGKKLDAIWDFNFLRLYLPTQFIRLEGSRRIPVDQQENFKVWVLSK